VHFWPEHDASVRVDERGGWRALDVVILLGPRPLALERDEADLHRGQQRQHRFALRRFEIDREHREAAGFVLLENLLQVGKLPTAAGSTREPEGDQHDATAIVGKLHLLASGAASTLALRAGAQSTSIAGRVVAGDSGDPVPNARVTLTGASQDVAVHLTDADGHFTFSASSGPHRLVVSKPGYARAEVTMNRARATEISLHRGAVIPGRVVDEFGDAVIESRVSAEAVSSGSPNAATLASTVRGG
jgi:hypothetical protein